MANPKMKWWDWLLIVLLSVGSINWGLVAFMNFNIVEFLANLIPIPMLGQIIYGLIAISGVYGLAFVLKAKL